MPANVRACIITIHNRPAPINYTELSTMSASEIIKQVCTLGQENKTLQENLDKAMTKIHELEQKNSDLLMSQTAEMRIHELEEKVKAMTKEAEGESGRAQKYFKYLTDIEKVMNDAEHSDSDGSINFFQDEDMKWENIATALNDRFEEMEEWAGDTRGKVIEHNEFIDELEQLHKSQWEAFKKKITEDRPDCPAYAC